MHTIREVLAGSRVFDLGPLPAPRLTRTATVQDAIQLMVRARRGAVVFIEDAKPIGIFTERDVLNRCCAGTHSAATARTAPAEAVMSQPPVTVPRQTPLHEAIGVMTRHNHRHLVVVDRSGDLRGLLTSNDIVQYLTDKFPQETMNLPPRLHQSFQAAGGA